jgi:hypothetical protein
MRATQDSINPIDIIVAIFKCSSPALKGIIAAKMFMCKLALLVFPRGQFLLKKVSWLVSDRIVFISFDFEIDGLPKRMNVIMSEGQSTDIVWIIPLSD